MAEGSQEAADPWTLPVDMNGSRDLKSRGSVMGGTLRTKTPKKKAPSVMRSAIARASTNTYATMDPNDKAAELMFSGLVSEFLIREYVTVKGKKNPGWTPADLYEWYQAKFGNPDGIEKSVQKEKRKEQGFTEEDCETSGDSSNTFRVAAVQRLRQRMDELLFRSWHLCDDEKLQAQWMKANRVQIDIPPIERFRNTINQMLDEGKLRHVMRRDVDQFIHEWKMKAIVPPFMMIEPPDTDSDANRMFWEYYHKDERKMQPSDEIVIKPRAFKLGAAKNRSASRGALNQLPRSAGSKSDVISAAPALATRLPPLGSEDSGSPMSTGSLEWSLDRHSKTMRSAFAHKLTKEKRLKKNMLPTIATGMQLAASAADRVDATAEMRRCASDPGIKPLPGIQKVDSELLPPVVGLAACMRSPVLPKSFKMDQYCHDATLTYIRAANDQLVIPHRSLLTMAKNRSIVARNGEMLTDFDLKAMTDMIRKLDRLELVDLTGSTLLSDTSVVALLKMLFGRPATMTLTRLSLHGCMRVGNGSVNTLVSLLTEADGVAMLKHLDLGGVEINSSSIIGFCEAVKEHPCLRSLNLARCGLGIHANASKYIATLLNAPNIEVLDLSWNCFNTDVFKTLGVGICEHNMIKELYLKHSSGSRGPTGEAPITSFLEELARDRTLHILDVSSNIIDGDAALVLEDSFMSNPVIREVRSSNNPMGVSGLRSFLRLLLRSETSSFRHFECHNCQSSQVSMSAGFNWTDPVARYELDLTSPMKRAVLRMLYKSCARFGLKPEDTFQNIKYKVNDEPCPYNHPTGKEPVSQRGILELTFCIDSLFGKRDWLDRGPPNVPSLCATTFMEKFIDRFQIKPGVDKVVPLLAFWHTNSGCQQEQFLLLQALAQDIVLNYAIVHSMAARVGKHLSLPKVDIMCNLLHSVGGTTFSRNRTLILLPRLDDFYVVNNKCRNFTNFNVEHATGSYFLNLGSPADFAVAQSIMILDRWEAVQAQSDERADASMHGNWSNIRNCVYGQELLVKFVNEWHLPAGNTLSFDFVSWRRPPAEPVPITDKLWASLLKEMVTSSCRFEDRTTAVKAIAHQIFVRSVHLRELLGMFMTLRDRVEVTVALYHRVSDPQNLKLVRGRMSGEDELGEVTARLGILNSMAFWQPECYNYRFDLETYEGRMATSVIVNMAYREKIENIKNPEWKQADGNSFPFTSGIPKWWDTYATAPEGGVLSITYSCAPELRQMELRQNMAQTYGGWKVVAKTDQTIAWWTTLNEVPDLLLQFMYHLMHSLPDPEALMRKICGNNKEKTSVSRFDFQQTVQKENWPQFQDPEVIRQVFRALDIDNNGEISSREWYTVGQLWKELQLSALEFVRQIQRTFGGDLDTALAQLDSDNDGGLDLEEWLEAAKMINYFGPSEPVFHMVANDKGVIDHNSWAKLKFFWNGREELYDAIRGSMKEAPPKE